jgi:PAS domain S-box-containing protein
MARDKDKPEENLRTRAEKFVTRPEALPENLSPEKMRSLIHELRVHQIELQMQNEELLRAQEEVQRARDRYFELYDLAPVGYLTLDRDGTILQANLRAADLLGRSRSHLLRRKFANFVAAPHLAAFVYYLKAFAEEGGQRSCDVVLRKRDGAGLPVHMETVRVDKGEKEGTFELRTTLTDISERKRREGELREARDHAERLATELEATFLSLTDGVIVYDANGIPIRVNPAAVQAYGFDLTGKKQAAVMERVSFRRPSGEPIAPADLPCSRALGGETVVGKRFLFTNADGRRLTILASASPLVKGGLLSGAVVIFHDVTEREALYRELEGERAKLSAVIAGAPEAIVVVDEQCRILLANPAAERLYARPIPYGKDVESQADLRLCHPSGESCQPLDLPLSRSALRGETHTNVELAVIWPDGQRRDLLVNTAPIQDQEGNRVGAVGVFQDITERLAQGAALRRARDELEARVQERTAELARMNKTLQAEIVEHKRTEGRLLEKNELLEGMFGSIHFLVAYMDRDFTFIRVNEAYARADGRAPGFFIGKDHFDLYPSEEHEAIFRKVVETGEPHFAYETPFVHTANPNPGRGVAFWDWSLHPVKEAEGSVSGVVLTLVDVTERRRAQEQLLSYQEQLRSLASQLMLTEERERRHLATDLHDSVCQLLALSKLKLDIARSTVSPGGLSASLEAVQSLIGQAINESRLLMFELSPQVLYLSGVETALKALFRRLREAHGLVVTFEGDGQPDRLSVDLRVFIYRAVRELLTNVVKHAGTQAARVSFRQEGAHMYVCIEDDGVGFDASELGSMKAEEGGGRFGLFSLRERSRHLCGRLEILSEPGHGTRVRLIVPASDAPHT